MGCGLRLLCLHEFVQGSAATPTRQVVQPLSVSCKCGRVVVFIMHAVVCVRTRGLLLGKLAADISWRVRLYGLVEACVAWAGDTSRSPVSWRR